MIPAVVVGLGFGDEGKGSVVDWLVRERGARTVVRFNGGAQAAHNVVTDDGRHHTFAQFGSGSLAGARTHLAHRVMVNPLALLTEGVVLRDKIAENPFDLITIDERCRVTTPFHIALNRLRELARGADAHGSCGMGIGETALDAIESPGGESPRGVVLRAGDFTARDLGEKIEAARRRAFDRASTLDGVPATDEALTQLRVLAPDAERDYDLMVAYRSLAQRIRPAGYLAELADGGLVFEGAQGVLLDESAGWEPHRTWSHTTVYNAYWDLAVALDTPSPETEVWGVTRAFHTRHGAGPFHTEHTGWRNACRDDLLVGEHNGEGRWQGAFRVGALDLPLLRHALTVQPCDYVAVTCLDRLASRDHWLVATDYPGGEIGDYPALADHPIEWMHVPTSHYARWLADRIADDATVALESWGPTAAAKRAFAQAGTLR